MAKAVTAGAVLVAAALPLAIATEAGAATIPASSYLVATAGDGLAANSGAAGSPAVFAQGWSGTGTFVFSATDSANLANASVNATVTSNATGVSFTTGAETVNTATQVVTTITVGAAVASGYYSATITDASGSVTIPNAFFIDAAPTFTSVTPASIPGGNSNIPVVIAGTGFTPATTVLFGVGSVGGTITPSSLAYVSPTQMTALVTTAGFPTGLYAATVANTDGGKTTATTGLTVTGPTITAISPTSLAIPATGSTTTPVTITGTGFETGAVVALTGATATVGAITYTSSTSITAAITVAAGTTAAQATVKVTNPDLSSASSVAGLGIGTASVATATVTAVAPSLSVTIGSIANLTLTGTGFGPAGNTHASVKFLSTAGIVDPAVTCSAITVTSDTSLTCTLAVASGAISGPHAVEVEGNPAGAVVESTPLANALTILGPTITAAKPASIPADFVGPITLTGTGFSSGTLSATVTGGTDSETGVTVAYVSSTQVTVTDTASTIGALDSPAVITLTDNGQLANFAIPVVIPPTISSVSYAAHTTGVGVGATAQPIAIIGTGFLPAATVTFGTTSGLSATVVSVTPTTIVATIKVASSAAVGAGVAANAITVTNTNGGTGTGVDLTVDAGVGVLSASPTTAVPSASVKNGTKGTLVLYSAGIVAGATVASSNSLVTLGTPTVAAGSISIPWTAAAIVGTVPVGLSLTVSNLDGGVSTFALSVAPGPTVVGTYYVPTSSTNFEVTIVGTGFESGMTVASSNAAYTVSLANINATNTAATLLVTTTSAATSGTFTAITFTNPDGGTVSFNLNGGTAPVPPVVVPLRASGVHGVARVGKTVTLTISGTGFYGQPRISSTGAGVRATVSRDTGTLLTVRVTVSAHGAKGEHTFTITLANGKSCRVNYATK
jgi:hypothetical protein